MFPTNYKLRPEPPRYVCPVRDCQRLMDTTGSLIGHFAAKHCNSMFNDNQDGTLSLVAMYKNSRSSSGGIVVSRNPLPPDAPPPAEPSLPFVTAAQRRRRLELLERASAKPATTAPESPPLVTSDIAPRDAKGGTPTDACSHLGRLLSPEQRIPTRDDVHFMLHLPLRRALPRSWIQRYGRQVLSVAMYAAALAYLVGDEVMGSEACRRRSSSPLSDPCVGLPSSMPEPKRRCFSKLPTCVSCFYRSVVQRQRNMCTWALEASAARGTAAAEDGDGFAERVKAEAEVDKFQEPAVGAAQTPTAASARELRRKRSAVDLDAGASPAKSARLSAGAGESAGAAQELEEWEMAPGRVTEETGTESGCARPMMLPGRC